MTCKSNAAPADPTQARPALECKVVVEASHIDFLNEGAVFAAGSGSGDCGCFISPLERAQKPVRRRQRAGQS